MSDELTIPVNVLLARLVPLISQDAELLALMRSVAGEFLKLTEPAAAPELPTVVTIAEEQATEPGVPQPTSPLPVVTPPQHVSLPSAPSIEVPVGWFRRLISAESDLQLIEARCRLKAEGARWVATRQRSIRDGASVPVAPR
jgi:hypothetical protein